jgi:hypothetical protein
MYSQLQVEVLLLLVELKLVLLTQVKKLANIIGLGAEGKKTVVLVLKCSVKFLTEVKPVITLVFCFVV